MLSTGRVLVQSWAGVTQEVLIFIPESPTQETNTLSHQRTQPHKSRAKGKHGDGGPEPEPELKPEPESESEPELELDPEPEPEPKPGVTG